MLARWIAAAVLLVLSTGVFFSNAVPDPWRSLATALGLLAAALLALTARRRPRVAIATA